jgi:hypothetical protein
VVATGALALGGGIALMRVAVGERDRAQAASTLEQTQTIFSEAQALNGTGIGVIIAGAVLLVGGATWLLLPQPVRDSVALFAAALEPLGLATHGR